MHDLGKDMLRSATGSAGLDVRYASCALACARYSTVSGERRNCPGCIIRALVGAFEWRGSVRQESKDSARLVAPMLTVVTNPVDRRP